MAVSIFDSAEAGSSLAVKAPAHLDPKTSVQSITELETLRPYLPPYSLVIVEDDGSIWQMMPDAADGWTKLKVGADAAGIDDDIVSNEYTYSSNKIDSTYSKIANVYDKATSDNRFGTLAQHKQNANAITQLQAKINSITPMQFKGVKSTYGDLLLVSNPEPGHMYMVKSDEHVGIIPFPSTTYIYDGSSWLFYGVNEIKQRDFVTDPINLGYTDIANVFHTEVTGKLPMSYIDFQNFNSDEILYYNTSYPNMSTVKDALDELLYTPLSIKFTSAASKVLERGASVINPIFNWSYNKNIVSQSIDGNVINDVSIRTYTYSGRITNDKNISLIANDGKSSFTSTISFRFYDAIISGTASEPAVCDSDFINDLSKRELKNTARGTYTYNCLDGEYIYIAIPTNLSSTPPVFMCGGFEGGLSNIDTITVTNEYGVQCNYNIYKSDNHSLGLTTIEIK